MAKFVINEASTSGKQTIEADTFQQVGEYWHFFSSESLTVFVISAARVHTIKRKSE